MSTKRSPRLASKQLATELKTRLNKKQIAQLSVFPSWVVERVQGSGLRYWKLWCSTKPDYDGQHIEAEGRTITEAVTLALKAVR
jgi:hypothetical protein